MARWTVAYKDSGVTVIHQPNSQRFRSVHLLAGHGGVILGAIFRRSRSSDALHSAVLDFDASESEGIDRSKGRYLVDKFWGSYIAIVRDRSARSCALLRDPTATLACYRAKWGSIDVFFSDLEDFTTSVPRPLSINWPHIAARMLAGCTQVSRDCGLQGIEDVPGGEWITFSKQGEARTVIWHPAQFCSEDGLQDEPTAENALKETVVSVVQTLASQHTDVLIRLSGGLDSSIVTACIGQQEARPNVTCVNYYIPPKGETDSPLHFPGLNRENLAKIRRVIGSADERDFARSVARRTGFKLVEVERRVADVNCRLLWTAPLTPRPLNYIYFVTEDCAEIEYVKSSRATACFTGEAGDTVFYCTLRAIGALDYAYNHPFGSHILHHVRATSALSGESIPRVLNKAVKYGLFRASLPPPHEPMKRPHLMRDEVAAAIQPDYFHHPWVLDAPPLCPGKRNQVSGLADSVLFYPYVQHREQVAPSIRPLASQPVVETCLRIPSYVLLADGISRGLARRAFGALLPPEVIRRTVKGLTTGFWQSVVRHNIAFIRECLLDGILIKQGLLDRRKTESYLVEQQPFITVGADQILEYLACEAWLSRSPFHPPCQR
ncbi:MAG TPA: asparagine synthase-related protein [Terriglobales bacterium]|nr:asparagine synthase-related protein [Terriglobales bacterium]